MKKTFSQDELALMWCRLNIWKHPTSDKAKWPEKEIAGAMALIVALIGHEKCLQYWNGPFRTGRTVTGRIAPSKTKGD